MPIMLAAVFYASDCAEAGFACSWAKAMAAVTTSSESGPVFSLARTGVTSATIRDGFAKACENAEITFGQTKAGGITWHDLRHTFATRLRGSRSA